MPALLSSQICLACTVVLFACCFALPLPPTTTPTPTVITTAGPIRGSISDGVASFLAVPYAAPPVGSLRFQPPAPPAKWSDVKDVTTQPPYCFQASAASAHQAEDCLYLNVFAPAASLSAPAAAVPVMIWIHGGSWTSGGAAYPVYQGPSIVKQGNVIVVSINYRLGAFGWLGHESLRSADGSTGNWGLHDQRLAMQWVAENIRAFGGDASRVTIFGESAGSGSVAAHLVSPLSKSLFSAAVMESGPFVNWISRNISAASYVFALCAAAASCASAADVPACLRSADAAVIQSCDHVNITGLPFSPVIDGVNLPDDPIALAKAGKFNRVPVVIGTNRDEGSLFTKQFYDFTPAQMIAFLDSTFGPAASQQIQMLYPLSAYATPWHALEMIDGDVSFACPSRRSARWLSAGPSALPVYLYHFVHAPEITSPDKHVLSCHSCELAFVFHYNTGLITPGERALSTRMVGLWTAFATNHSPADNSTWPEYGASGSNIVLDADALGAKISVQNALKQAECDFWDSLIADGQMPSVFSSQM